MRKVRGKVQGMDTELSQIKNEVDQLDASLQVG